VTRPPLVLPSVTLPPPPVVLPSVARPPPPLVTFTRKAPGIPLGTRPEKISLVLPGKPGSPLVKPEESSLSEPETCCVCLDPINTKLAKCGHDIHIECVIKSGKPICPLCRGDVRMTAKERRLTDEYAQKYRQQDQEERTARMRDRGADVDMISLLAFMMGN